MSRDFATSTVRPPLLLSIDASVFLPTGVPNKCSQLDAASLSEVLRSHGKMKRGVKSRSGLEMLTANHAQGNNTQRTKFSLQCIRHISCSLAVLLSHDPACLTFAL